MSLCGIVLHRTLSDARTTATTACLPASLPPPHKEIPATLPGPVLRSALPLGGPPRQRKRSGGAKRGIKILCAIDRAIGFAVARVLALLLLFLPLVEQNRWKETKLSAFTNGIALRNGYTVFGEFRNMLRGDIRDAPLPPCGSLPLLLILHITKRETEPILWQRLPSAERFPSILA